MSYMLDTDTCIYLMSNHHPERQARVVAALEGLSSDATVYLSSVVAFELAYGAQKSRWKRANLELLDEFLLDFVVVPFDEKAARVGGAIRAELEKKGRVIGPMDTLIAAHAVSLDLPLITHNWRELSRVPGLKVENWAGE